MSGVKKILALFLVPCLIALNAPVTYSADTEQGGPSLTIRHQASSKTQAGQVISLKAYLKDREGIELVRIYFKTIDTEPYFFVPMIVAKGDEYFGMVPAPLETAGNIEYLFLVKTYSNRIFTSKKYTMQVTLPTVGQKQEPAEILDVMTETTKQPLKIKGFDSRSRIRLVTKHEKHGVLAGLYSHEQTGGTASNGQYHGTVAASKDSGLNPYIIGGGIAVGAVAIALAAGSSGSGSSNDSPPSPPTPVVESTGAGTWTLEYTDTPCSRTTTQTIACSEEGLVTAVSPTAVGIPIPPDCANSPFNGLSDVFIVGDTCDSVTACTNYTAIDLVNKTCEDSNIIFTRNGGVRTERWTIQATE